MIEKEFNINKYIILRLEHGQTNIYVNGQLFNQCKYLLLNLSKADFKAYEGIQSIDEAFERYSREHESNKSVLDPETEFIGHCSNLQAWYEQDYDVRILHSSLSLPLLKKLALIGDSKAKIVFKELIAQRLAQGGKNTIISLFDKTCLEIFEPQELEVIIESTGHNKADFIDLLLERQMGSRMRTQMQTYEHQREQERDRDRRKLGKKRRWRLKAQDLEIKRRDYVLDHINQSGKEYVEKELAKGHKYVISYLHQEQLPVFTIEDLETLFEIIDIEDQELLKKINRLINQKRIINKLKRQGKATINVEERYKDVKRLYF